MDPNVTSVVRPGRPGGRRRLLRCSTCAASARSAGRAHGLGRAGSRGGDPRSGGARLRSDRDRGDGGDAAQRRPDLHLVRGRDDDVVAVAMVASLTVLPAVLSKLGDRVEKGRIPFLGRLGRAAPRPLVLGGVVDAGDAPPGRSRWSLSAGAADRPGGPGARHADGGQRRRRTCRATSPSCRRTTASPRPSRAKPPARGSWSRPTTSTRARSRRRSPTCVSEAREPTRRSPVEVTVDASADGDRRRDRRSRPSAAAATPTATRAMESIREQLRAGGVRRGRRRRGQRHRRRPPSRRTSTTSWPSALPLVFAFVLGLAFLLMLVTLPLDRRPDQGDRAEPALGRRRLRGPGRWSSRTGWGSRCWASTPTAASAPGCRCSSS